MTSSAQPEMVRSRPVSPAGLTRPVLVSLIVFVVIAFVVHCQYYRPFIGIDDADITQVYADNLVHGHGWVYEPGQERVEGTTSFLQTLIWTGAFLTPYPMAVMHLLQLCFCLVTCWFALSILNTLRSGRGHPQGFDFAIVGYFCWLGLNPCLITWMTISLMDVSIWTLLLLMAIGSLCRFIQDAQVSAYALRTSLLATILVLTRPESLALAPFLIALGGAAAWHADRTPRSFVRATVMPAIAYATTAAGLTLFRLLYFGYPLPNTYYAKLSPHFWYNVTGGIRYIIRSLQICPIALPLLFAACFLLGRALWRLVRERDTGVSESLTVAVLLPAIAFLAIAVVNGGDHFSQGRFLVQFNLLLPIPILALLNTPAWLKAGQRPVILAILGVISAVTIDLLQVSVTERAQPLLEQYVIAQDGIEAGQLLSRAFPDGKVTVGVSAAGGIARSYRGYIIDLLGLNNTAIAHSNQGLYGVKNHAAFSRPVFFQLKPDLVFPHLMRTDSEFSLSCSIVWDFEDRITRGLLDEKDFSDLYQPVDIRLRPGVQEQRSDLLIAKPAFLSGLMESAAVPVQGVRMYIRKALLPAVPRDIFDVSPLACGNSVATPPPPAKPPQIRGLGFLDDIFQR